MGFHLIDRTDEPFVFWIFWIADFWFAFKATLRPRNSYAAWQSNMSGIEIAALVIGAVGAGAGTLSAYKSAREMSSGQQVMKQVTTTVRSSFHVLIVCHFWPCPSADV